MCRHNERAACVHRDKTETMQKIVTEGNTQPLQQNFVIHSVDRSREVEQDKCSTAVSPQSTASSRSESTRMVAVSVEWPRR